ncbi:MAG: extracellular solute-binding protein [Lachnospiraceae bacterium]|nr:extracellular solute-binding protein [Lachnospiraceae bacterium]
MDKIKHKNSWMTIIGAVLFLGAVFIMNDGYKKIPFRQDTVLTIGVFSDSYWEVQNGYSYQILEDAIALFEEEHEGVKVQYVSGILKEDYPEWLAEQMILGRSPDLFFIFGENFNNLAEIGALKDLGRLMEADNGFARERFYTSALNCGKYGEQQYALPYECAPKLMFVNKTILTQEGIELPDEDWTWDDFYEICEAVTKDTDGNGTLDQFGVVGYTWSDAFDSNGVQLFDRKGTECHLTDEGVREAILFMEKLDGLYDGYNVTSRDFDLGNVAFQPMFFAEYRAYKPYPLSIKKYSGFEWECIPMPSGRRGANIAELDTLLLAMNGNTTQTEYAWEFMKLLSGDERIQSEIFAYSEGVSVIRDVTEADRTLQLLIDSSGDDNGLNLRVLSNAVENAVVAPKFRNNTEVAAEVDKAVRDIMKGSSNISMEQIIWNREINNFLKNRMER